MTARTRGRSVARLALAALAAAQALAAAGPLEAQQGCQFIEGTGNLQRVDMGAGEVTYVSTPNLSCRDGVRIRADSAVAFQASNYVQLIGNVRFDDPERRLTAQHAEYFTTVGRLQAHRGAEITQKTDSSWVRGEEMVYNRPDRERPRAQLDVYGGRPTARLYLGRDSTALEPASTPASAQDSASSPYDIVADRILIEADTYFRARGDVEIVREPSRGDGAPLRAYGDSVEYDQAAATLRLMSRARMRIDGRDLTAELITAELPGDEVREVVARRKAVVVAEDIRLSAPLVRVFFVDGAMDRLVAVPLTAPAPAPPAEPSAVLPAPGPVLSEEDRAKPVATAEDFTIVADSLDVLAPGEVLDRIHAVGHARAESSARDSLNTEATPRLARTDWMEGDTIVARFRRVGPDGPGQRPDSVPSVAGSSPDTARAEYRLDRLSASGKARSLYRMEPSDSVRARGKGHPAIHYVAAESIELVWNAGEIRAMEVRGQTEGVHAEPEAAPVDSAAVPADSAAVPGGAPLPAAPAGTPTDSVGPGATPLPPGTAVPADTARARRGTTDMARLRGLPPLVLMGGLSGRAASTAPSARRSRPRRRSGW